MYAMFAAVMIRIIPMAPKLIVIGSILSKIRERRNESAAIPDRDLQPKTRGLDIVRREIVAQPGQDERGARERAGGYEEGPAVFDSRVVGGELHYVADGGEGGPD